MNTLRPLTVLFVSATLALCARADFHDHVGIQTWSLRDTTKAKGFLASLDQIKAWGIVEIEGSLTTDKMTPEQVRAAIDERGLKMPSAHVGYADITKQLPEMVHNAQVLGVKYAICPWIPHDDKAGFNQAEMEQAVKDFNQAGAAFRAAGIKFGYHPHGYESLPGAKPGETLLDDLIHGCNPADVCFEMDVFWIVHGGWDPVKLLEKYSGRWMGLHVKDIRKGAPTGFHTAHAPATDNVAVGYGAIEWKPVLSTAAKVGVEYYFIEDETPAPLTNVPLSQAFLKTLKL
jgi:sugar phosphate isomerase/epimerase